MDLQQKQMEEALKITRATKQRDGSTAFVWKDGQGNDIDIDSLEAFARNIGDVDTAAQNAIVDMEFSEAHKENVANANITGQGSSGGSSSGSK